MDLIPVAIWVLIGIAGLLFAVKVLYGVSIALVLPLTQGALYVSTARTRVAAMLEAVAPEPGQVLVDLGCGDGRVLRCASRRYHVYAQGYELNPLAYLKARLMSLGYADVAIHRRNFWKADLSSADVVCCYLFPDVMSRLAGKLHDELKAGATVVSFNFPLPGFDPDRVLRPGGQRTNDPVYIYRVQAPGTHSS
ncbi:MAG: hypothetical protein QNJ04_04780 [Desulfobacterales bacterium]|nr:hypothetical protein [Desulfobacterales bacterium]